MWDCRNEHRQLRKKSRTHRECSVLQADPMDNCWVGGAFRKEQAGNWVARVPEPERRKSLPRRENGEGRSMARGANPK